MAPSIEQPDIICSSLIFNNGATGYAIVNDRLSALELAITLDIGHDGWANVVTLSNNHNRSLFTSRFHLFKNTEVWKHHKNAFKPHFKIKILVLEDELL